MTNAASKKWLVEKCSHRPLTVIKKKTNGKIHLAAMHIIAFRELISSNRANNENAAASLKGIAEE